MPLDDVISKKRLAREWKRAVVQLATFYLPAQACCCRVVRKRRRELFARSAYMLVRCVSGAHCPRWREIQKTKKENGQRSVSAKGPKRALRMLISPVILVNLGNVNLACAPTHHSWNAVRRVGQFFRIKKKEQRIKKKRKT